MSGLKRLPQLTWWLFGSLVIVLAGLSLASRRPLHELLAWFEKLFSPTFIIFFSGLTLLGIYAIWQCNRAPARAFYLELGQQTGNAIATLALTYTLLGISLGISSLSSQPLTPESVQAMIGDLTRQFAMAFMTTVLGLPTATLIRALSSLAFCKTQEAHS